MSVLADDTASNVLEVHERWRLSQVGWKVDQMISCKAKGTNFLQYNLDGHIYRGSHELAALWEQMREHVDLVASEDMTPPNIMMLGDLVVLSIDLSVMRFRVPEPFTSDTGIWSITFEPDGTDLFFRSTEVYRKDDGSGRPEWRMWRAHYHRVTGKPS